jgi:hypothetical protein
MILGAVYRDNKVVLRFYQPVPKYVKIGTKEYVCDVRYGVSLLFVEESEAPTLLNHIGGCCGGQKKVFSLCSDQALRVWETGER